MIRDEFYLGCRSAYSRATFFLEYFDERRRLSSKAKHKLEAYPWPRNVHELVRVIELSVK